MHANTENKFLVVQIGSSFLVRKMSRTFLDGKLIVSGIADVAEYRTREEADRHLATLTG